MRDLVQELGSADPVGVEQRSEMEDSLSRVASYRVQEDHHCLDTGADVDTAVSLGQR
jgi:hypothetical protein